jgi:uncharacterized protein (TIGR04255 family)
MADVFPTLARPPIVEGLLDIQVEPLDQDRLPVLESLQTKYPDFPHKADRLQFAGAIQVFPTPGTAVSQSKIGYQLSTADGTRVIQVRLDGVTVSILKPYTKFADLEAEGRQLWKHYCDGLQPKRALRIALRYINRIEVPPNRDLKESFLTTPEIAPALPQMLNGYLMRIILPDTKTASNAILTQVLEGGPDGKPSVIFDIDVFQMVDLRPNDSKIWEIVADLRNYKNRIFFGSITEQLRREFE